MAACENKAILDLSAEMIKALQDVQTDVAGHQQELLLHKARIGKHMEAIKTMQRNWDLSPGEDFLSLLANKNQELQSFTAVAQMPQSPNYDAVRDILDNYSVSKHL